MLTKAQYQLSLKSTVSKANSGKIEKLGTFQERADRIKNTSSSNFFTNMNNNNYASNQHFATAATLDTYYGKGANRQNHQQRGNSQMNLKAVNELQIESNQLPTSVMNSNISSFNIKSSKYNQRSTTNHNLLQQSRARKAS